MDEIDRLEIEKMPLRFLGKAIGCCLKRGGGRTWTVGGRRAVLAMEMLVKLNGERRLCMKGGLFIRQNTKHFTSKGIRLFEVRTLAKIF